MPASLIATAGLSDGQLSLVEEVAETVSTLTMPIRIYFGVPYESPSAHGVLFKKPGQKPTDSHLERLYDHSPEGGPHFIVALRDDVVTDAGVVLVLAHELEHARQESIWPGILALGHLVRAFVAERQASFPELPGELFLPVNWHAEAAAYDIATSILGAAAVHAEYDAQAHPYQTFSKADPAQAAADLASFLNSNWLDLQDWYGEAWRPGLPDMGAAAKFMENHA